MTPEEIIFQKADKMRDALTNLLNQLAKDGTAITEFAEAYKASSDYTEAVFNYRMDLLIIAGNGLVSTGE